MFSIYYKYTFERLRELIVYYLAGLTASFPPGYQWIGSVKSKSYQILLANDIRQCIQVGHDAGCGARAHGGIGHEI